MLSCTYTNKLNYTTMNTSLNNQKAQLKVKMYRTYKSGDNKGERITNVPYFTYTHKFTRAEYQFVQKIKQDDPNAITWEVLA